MAFLYSKDKPMKTLRYIVPLVVGFVFFTPALAIEAPSVAAGAVKAGSVASEIPKLGKISPNGPYRLWIAINNVLPEYALSKGGRELKSRVEGLSAFEFEGKTPGDVLAQAKEYRATLDRLRVKFKLATVKTYKDPLGRAVTPGVVFVNAGHIMDATAHAFHATSKEPDTVILGGFYDVPVVTGKSPSHVFGLVELATRRLRLIAGS